MPPSARRQDPSTQEEDPTKTLLRLYQMIRHTFTPDQINQCERLIAEYRTVQNSIRKLLSKITRYEYDTGFDFTRESSRIG